MSKTPDYSSICEMPDAQISIQSSLLGTSPKLLERNGMRTEGQLLAELHRLSSRVPVKIYSGDLVISQDGIGVVHLTWVAAEQLVQPGLLESTNKSKPEGMADLEPRCLLKWAVPLGNTRAGMCVSHEGPVQAEILTQQSQHSHPPSSTQQRPGRYRLIPGTDPLMEFVAEVASKSSLVWTCEA
ncbi:hypothetical protein TREES_T100016905 [Tupaia chinensis]|uniref:Uncharacterized protein n=1 Tax=Tupaia chinensis TaxID=246437 RepID=L9KXR1_TUPCH|nr:hypothetical protein TREES_T100016905 [Tupaia chinensis]